MIDKHHDTPTTAGYGTSSPEAVNASGYRYPASHFIPPAPLEDRRDSAVPEVASDETLSDPPTSSTKNTAGPRLNKAQRSSRG